MLQLQRVEGVYTVSSEDYLRRYLFQYVRNRRNDKTQRACHCQ